jgi:hypothetical protein
MLNAQILRKWSESDDCLEYFLENQRASYYKISTNNARRKLVKFKRLLNEYDLYYDLDIIKQKMHYNHLGHLTNYLEKAMGYKFIQLYYKEETDENILLKKVYEHFHFNEIVKVFEEDICVSFFKNQLENNVNNPWRKIRMMTTYFKYLKSLTRKYPEMTSKLKEEFFDRKYEVMPIFYPKHKEAYEILPPFYEQRIRK